MSREKLFVGGKIYYIDSEDNGATYHFYDANGEEMTDVKVGDRPFQYSIEGNPSKDKYYVFCSKPMGYWEWGNYDKLLGTKTEIGTGRENTKLILNNPSYGVSLKRAVILMNWARSPGCFDWFIPSKDEVQELVRSGLANDIFEHEWVWSSSEYSTSYAWYWYSNNWVWYYSLKYGKHAFVGVRAF